MNSCALFKLCMTVVISFCFLISESANGGVDVQMKKENISDAKLAALDASSVTIVRKSTADSIPETFPIKEVKSIIFSKNKEESIPVNGLCKILFEDGGDCLVRSFALVKQELTFEMFCAKSSSQCRRSEVRAIVLDLENCATDMEPEKQWNGLFQEVLNSASDTLVVLRDGKLLHYSGLVLSIDAERILFEHEGEVLKLKKSKVFGLIFSNNKIENERQEKVAEISVGNSKIYASSVVLKTEESENILSVRSVSGIDFQWNVQYVNSINYESASNIAISSLKPVFYEYTPYFSTDEKNKPEIFEPFEMDDQKIVVGGLLLKSKSQVVFMIPDGMKIFSAKIGITDSSRPHGDVSVRILLDEKEIYVEKITGQDSARNVDITLNGEKKITFVVDYGKGMDFSDNVGIMEAVFSK